MADRAIGSMRAWLKGGAARGCRQLHSHSRPYRASSAAIFVEQRLCLSHSSWADVVSEPPHAFENWSTTLMSSGERASARSNSSGGSARVISRESHAASARASTSPALYQ